MELLYILSTKAGKGRSKELRRMLRETENMRNLDRDIRIVETEHANHAEEAAAAFVEDGANKENLIRVVYVLGGDGTSSEVAAVLAGTGTALGVLPAGTANDFAKQLYPKGTKLKDLLERSLSPTLEPIDLYEVNGITALNVASFGIDTIILEQALQYLKTMPKLNAFAYVLAILRRVPQIKAYPYTWEFLDHEEKLIKGEGKLSLATICNGGFYGDGYQPAPDAKLDDGLLNIGLAGEARKRELPKLLSQYKEGTHVDHPLFTRFKATEGVFYAAPGEELLANYDGIILRAPELRFKVLPKRILLARI